MYRSAALGAALLALALLIVRYPGDSFQAALQGLSIWWNLVFPGLLPFLALSELLLALGVVHAAGVLLEPVMRRVFRLPGSAGWAAAVALNVIAIEIAPPAVRTLAARSFLVSRMCLPIGSDGCCCPSYGVTGVTQVTRVAFMEPLRT